MVAVEQIPGAEPARIRVAFELQEAEILSELARQFVRLVTDSPDDTAASQLFPAGYDDPAAQAEFSRFTRSDLSERKRSAANTVIGALAGPPADGVLLELTADSAWHWLTFCTDSRMVLAERIREGGESDEGALQQGLADWVAYLQGAMVEALMDAPGFDATTTANG